MYNKVLEVYELAKKAQKGDELALVKLLELKRPLISKASEGNEDCFQHIIEKLIKAIKNYKF